MSAALTLQVRIVSLSQEIYSGTALQVSAPALMGEVGILPRHAPLLTRLREGPIRVRTPDNRQDLIYVSGGMLEIQPFEVTVLADVAVRATDSDIAAAEEARRLAEEAAEQVERFTDRDQAYAELVASIAEINVLKGLYQKKRRW